MSTQDAPLPDVPAAQVAQGLGAGEVGAEIEALEEPVDFTRQEWSRPWMGEFLNLMATLPIAASAARQVGIARRTVYEAKLRDPVFAAAWKEAYERGVDVALHATWRWGITGVEWTERETREEVDHQGRTKSVTVTRTHHDRNPQIAMMILKAHRPEYRDQAKVEHTGSVSHVVERMPTRERMLELAAIARDLEIEGQVIPGVVPDDVEAS